MYHICDYISIYIEIVIRGISTKKIVRNKDILKKRYIFNK